MEERPDNIDRQNEKSKLVEYEVCQNHISSSELCFWTLSSIFFGFSAVLLGGVIYGLIANNELLTEFVNTPILYASGRIFVIRIMVSIIAIGMVIIYFALNRWRERVSFLSQRGYERIRQLELDLYMRRSLLIHGIDCWGKLEPEAQKRLTDLNLKDWCESWRCGCRKQEYKPSSKYAFIWMFYTLIVLWSLTVLGIWFLPLILYWLGI